MELIQAIALLCQISTSGYTYPTSQRLHIECQQSYLNCVSKRRSIMKETEALEKCILEK